MLMIMRCALLTSEIVASPSSALVLTWPGLTFIIIMILDNGPIFYSILGLCVLNNLASPIRTIGKETTKVRNFRGRELVLETAARIIN